MAINLQPIFPNKMLNHRPSVLSGPCPVIAGAGMSDMYIGKSPWSVGKIVKLYSIPCAETFKNIQKQRTDCPHSARKKKILLSALSRTVRPHSDHKTAHCEACFNPAHVVSASGAGKSTMDDGVMCRRWRLKQLETKEAAATSEESFVHAQVQL